MKKIAGILNNRAQVDANSVNSENRTFKVVFATETPVFRRGWEEDYNEVLGCNKQSIRAERLDNGSVPLVDSHNTYSIDKVMGRVIAWEIVGNECHATIQFSTQERFNDIWKDIQAGIIRNISVGYRVWQYERIPSTKPDGIPTYRSNDWEPMEITLAAVQADFNSAVRSESDTNTYEVEILNYNRSVMNENNTTAAGAPAANETPVQEENRSAGTTPPAATEQPAANAPEGGARSATQQPAAPQANDTMVASIVRSCESAGLDLAFANTLIARNLSREDALAAIVDEVATRNANNMRNNNPAAASARGDEREQVRTAMADALIHRAEPGAVQLNERSSDFRHMSHIDMARHCLEANGERNTHRFSKDELVHRAIATTDFPDLFTSAINRQLRRFYEQAPSNWRPLGVRMSVPDFRAKTGIEVDGNFTFDKIAEDGEYKAATIQTGKATISVETYGKMIKVTRKTIINDDLDVLSSIPRMYANGAAALEANLFWAMVTTPAKTPDNKNLFHSDHGNLAGSGGAISDTTLNAAVVAMGLQKSPAGMELGLSPKYLVVPLEQQMAAQRLMSTIVAAQTGNVNTFQNAFEIISEVRLSRNSSTAWYLFADPSLLGEGLMYAYMDGSDGLFTDSRTNFTDDSFESKARLEIGMAAWNWRGAYKNPGQ